MSISRNFNDSWGRFVVVFLCVRVTKFDVGAGENNRKLKFNNNKTKKKTGAVAFRRLVERRVAQHTFESVCILLIHFCYIFGTPNTFRTKFHLRKQKIADTFRERRGRFGFNIHGKRTGQKIIPDSLRYERPVA